MGLLAEDDGARSLTTDLIGEAMSKYLVLYRAEASAAEQLANATPEQQRAGMQAWMDWFGNAGSAVVDGGSPVSGTDQTIGGYSILQADSRDALDALLVDHPHTMVGTLEIYDCLAMPGI
jgi:hypothetical protein